MASSVVGPRRSSKALPKAKLEPKKRSWSPFDGPLLVWSYSSFLNLRETITSEKYAQQIEEMHQKLQSLQPALINRKGPILFYNNARLHIARPMLQKWNELGCEVLPRLPYSPDLSPADHHVLKHINFVQGICFHAYLGRGAQLGLPCDSFYIHPSSLPACRHSTLMNP